MFQAYVAVTFKKHLDLVEANPYTIVMHDDKLYLQEISKEEATGVVFYMLDELSPKEIYLFKDSITVLGVDDVIKTRKNTLRK